MPWTERVLESLYLYGRVLQAVQGEEENLSLVTGTDEPGVALPGQGTGRTAETPMGRLSELIEQQKQAVKDDARLREVALNNDRDSTPSSSSSGPRT